MNATSAPSIRRVVVVCLLTWALALIAALIARADDAPPSVHSFHVGAIRCDVLYDTTAAYDSVSFFVNTPAEELAAALQSSGQAPAGKIRTPYAALLVRTSTNTILIDTGGGPSTKPGGGLLMANLAAAGVAPEAVDTVILTHGHLDHIGGTLTADGAIAFPRARFVMARAEWEYWDQETPDLSALEVAATTRRKFTDFAHARLRPLRDRIELVDTDAEIRPGVSARLAPGHTPGQMLVRLDSGGQSLLYVSDLVFAPLALEHPDWHSRYECDPDQAGLSRRAVLDRAARENLLVHAMHFPWPGLGRVAAQGDHWVWSAESTADLPAAPDLLTWGQ